MTDFRELKELDYEDSAIYRRTNGDVVQITRVDEKPPVRQWDTRFMILYTATSKTKKYTI